MQPKIILSLDATVPLNVAVVVVLAVCLTVSAVVVTSHTEQAQPFGEVAPFPMVTTKVQLVAPASTDPAVAPPVKVVSEHPALLVKVVPTDI